MILPIQMYNPKREYQLNKIKINNAIQNVLNHGQFINGPEIQKLEKNLSQFTNTKHCICVSNGTDALKISLLALGIQPYDEVITVAYSWISTVEVISIINAKPVFVDIENKTFNIDHNKLEEKINNKTKAIIIVSLYGQICNIDKVNEIASKFNIPVIEDGAQSFGALYDGKRSCSLTTIGTTSFFPSKPFGCYGDGGACFTNDDNLAEIIRAIKNHGGIKRFHHKYIGLNGRLDTIQAAILNVKFNYFEDTLNKRNNCANYYSKNLEFLEKKNLIKLPKVKDNCTSSWAQYSILAKSKIERDNIVDFLKENKVNVAIFYPKPLHLQECFKYLEYKKNDLPITENICNTVFNLPCYAELSKEEQNYIINILVKYFN